MSWLEKAKSVRSGFFHITIAGTTPDQANLIMAAMIGLATLEGCPTDFARMAKELPLDGKVDGINAVLPLFNRICEGKHV